MLKKIVAVVTLFMAAAFSISAKIIWDYEERVQKLDSSVIKDLQRDSEEYSDWYGEYSDLPSVLCCSKDGETFLEKYIKLKNEAVVNFLIKGFGVEVFIYNTDADILKLCAKYGTPKMFNSFSVQMIKSENYPLNELDVFKLAQENTDSGMVKAVLPYIKKSFEKRNSMTPVLEELIADEKLTDDLLEAKVIDNNFLHLIVDYYYRNNEKEQEILNFAEKLLKSGAKVDVLNKDGETPLLAAAEDKFFSYEKLLLKYNANPNKFPKDEKSPLLNAIYSNNIELVNLLLEKGADMNALSGYYKETPLHAAADEGYYEIVKLLVEKGANVNTVSDSSKETALAVAACENSYETVKYLLEHGAKPNIKNKYGSTALNELTYEDIEIFKILVEHGADVNSKDDNGFTPLMVAAACSRLDVVQLYLDYKPDFSVRSKDGNNIFHAMMYWTLPHIVYGISDNGSWVEGSGLDNELVQLLVEKGVDINGKNGEGLTAIQIACVNRFDLLEDVEILINNGADLSVIGGEHKDSLLMFAVGNPKVIQLLLSKGADKSYVNADGKNAYDWAMELAMYNHGKGEAESVRILYDEEIDGQKNYSLQDALEAGNVVLAKKLLAECKDINAKDEKYRWPLKCAVLSQNTELIKLVLDRKPVFSQTDKSDKNDPVLLTAVKKHNVEIVKLLLEAGANPNERTMNSGCSESPLYAALFNEAYSNYSNYDFEIIKLLIKYGADPNGRGGYENETDFMLACDDCSYIVVELLLQNGADIFVTDNDMDSPYSVTGNYDKRELLKKSALNQLKSKKVIAKADIKAKEDSSFYASELSVLKKGSVLKVLEVNPEMKKRDGTLGFWIRVELTVPVKSYYGDETEGWVFSADVDIR